MDVAHTILAQLGGSKFIAMTGAKSFLSEKDALSFNIPKARAGVNCVRVQLTPADTYTVRFYKIGRAPKLAIEVVATYLDVYADSLASVFSDATGLAVSL